jgi:hypothetical protein
VPFSSVEGSPVPSQQPAQRPASFDTSMPGLRVFLEKVPGLTKKGLLDSRFVFQVPPLEEFRREYGYEFSDYLVVSGKTQSRAVGRQLARVTFQALFVDFDASWAAFDGSSIDPVAVTEELREICESGTPFRFLARNPPLWGSVSEVKMNATLRSLSVVEKAGEVDARYADVEFVEWGDNTQVSSKRQGKLHPGLPAKVTLNANGSAYVAPQQAVPAWGTGNPVTLHKLAKQFYGSASRWQLIAKRNHGLLSGVSPSRPLNEVLGKAIKQRTAILTIPKPPDNG